MKRVVSVVLVCLAAAIAAAVVTLLYVRSTGLTARSTPGALESFIARNVRSFAVPPEVRERRNPVARSAEVLAEGRSHFADHCASCHGNDGSGKTEMGQGLWPKPPDMRLEQTQNLTDGELFYIIEEGIRFTGMPGWSTGTKEGEDASWHLVHFIRHLPQVTEAELAEMEDLNPRSPVEIRQEIEEERFLQGGDAPSSPPAATHAH